MKTLLEIKSISKTFGKLKANSEISFEVKKGEILAILGENGAGKTTLMNILFGHYMPDTGNIYFKINLDFEQIVITGIRQSLSNFG